MRKQIFVSHPLSFKCFIADTKQKHKNLLSITLIGLKNKFKKRHTQTREGKVLSHTYSYLMNLCLQKKTNDQKTTTNTILKSWTWVNDWIIRNLPKQNYTKAHTYPYKVMLLNRCVAGRSSQTQKNHPFVLKLLA